MGRGAGVERGRGWGDEGAGLGGRGGGAGGDEGAGLGAPVRCHLAVEQQQRRRLERGEDGGRRVLALAALAALAA
ncbi:unnamed protein product [Lampetra planeri]